MKYRHNLHGDPEVFLSVRDIARAAHCRWRFMVAVDRLVGHHLVIPHHDPDPLRLHIADLTRHHMSQILEHYYGLFGPWRTDNPHGVMDFEGVKPSSVWDIAARSPHPRAHYQRLRAAGVDTDLFSGTHDAMVIHAEDVASGHVYGQVPFSVYTDEGIVVHTGRFSSHIKVDTRMALAGAVWLTHETLRHEVPLAPYALVTLASGRTESISTAVLCEEFTQLRLELEDSVRTRLSARKPASWRCVEQVCGQCADCQEAIQAHDDVLRINGLGVSTRTKLHALGIDTMHQVAELPSDSSLPEGISPEIVAQARVQVKQIDAPAYVGGHRVVVDVDRDNPVLAQVPEPRPRDVYLDFENDSMWEWTPRDHTGLVYLAGVVVRDGYGAPPSLPGGRWTSSRPATMSLDELPHPSWTYAHSVSLPLGELSAGLGWRYWALWAHNREQEGELLRGVVSWLEERHEADAQMHVYHYSTQEKLYMRRLARRHGMLMDRVGRLIGKLGIFYDLSRPVNQAIRTGQGGYSLKDMEPLYMGKYRRGSTVHDGSESIVLYDQAREMSQLPGGKAHWDKALHELAEYNEYDCVSTLLLHRWLLSQRHTERM